MSANLMSLASSGGKFLKLFGDRKMMKPLPYDAEIEYLESDGGQFINTGVKYQTPANIYISITPITLIGERQIFGARVSSNSKASIMFLGGVGMKIFPYVSNGSVPSGSQDLYVGYQYDVSIDVQSLTRTVSHDGTVLNSWSMPSVNSFTGETPMYVFNASGNPTSQDGFIGRIHYLKVDGLLYLIPVRVGNVGYMYDRVSGELFGNVGTGAFVIGPDKTI